MIENENDIRDYFEDYVFEPIPQERKPESKNPSRHIPVINRVVDLIQKKRELKRWKTSFGNYSLNPDKFRFSARDLYKN